MHVVRSCLVALTVIDFSRERRKWASDNEGLIYLIDVIFLQFNLTHHIRHLSFGHEYPGIKHPLDDTFVSAEDCESSCYC